MADKLPSLRPRQLVSALVRAGFILFRQKGSHAQFRKGTLTVTVRMHVKDIKRGTLASILRQARLTVEELRSLLSK